MTNGSVRTCHHFSPTTQYGTRPLQPVRVAHCRPAADRRRRTARTGSRRTRRCPRRAGALRSAAERIEGWGTHLANPCTTRNHLRRGIESPRVQEFQGFPFRHAGLCDDPRLARGMPRLLHIVAGLNSHAEMQGTADAALQLGLVPTAYCGSLALAERRQIILRCRISSTSVAEQPSHSP